MWKDENAFVWRCWLQLHLHVKHDVKRGSAWSLSIPSAHQQPVLPRLFLCSICAPTYQPNVTDQISPCHSLFTQGKRGCAPVMCQYGFRWPKTMRCRHFPKANGNRLRVDRNAMVRNSALTITRQQEIPKQKRGKIVKNGISSWLLSLPVLEVELQSKVIFQCGYVRSYL